ncbi:MAG: RNase H-like domain-containing protein, partial [Pseudomonadota bacterium]
KMKINTKKTKLGVREVKYLGFKINSKGREIDMERVAAIAGMIPPSNVRQLRAFLGLVSYVRAFVPNLSIKAAPLFQLLKKDEPFVWTVPMQESFTTVKSLIASAQALVHPDVSKTFFVATDASGSGIGAALLQEHDGCKRPVMYISRTLKPGETKWSTIELEALAVIWALGKLDVYLCDKEFVLLTDHKNLTWFDNVKSARVSRWKLFLQQLRFRIEYIPGKNNAIADALSRNSTILCNITSGFPGTALMRHIKSSQARHSQALEEGEGNMEQVNGMWKEKDSRKVWLPEEGEIRKEIVTIAHEKVVGHGGRDKTWDVVRQHFMGKGLGASVERIVAECPTCQKTKRGNKKLGLLQTYYAKEPFEVWHVDFVGPLEGTKSGNVYLLVIVDNYSRWTALYPCKAANSDAALQGLWSRVISQFGVPKSVVSDGGSHFKNAVIEGLCEWIGTRKRTVLPYTPTSNGRVERMNQTVEGMIGRLTLSGDQEWDQVLSDIEFYINGSSSRATGFSPFHLLFGKPMHNWFHLMEPLPDIELPTVSYEDAVIRLQETLAKVRDAGKERMDGVAEKAKERYDKGRKDVHFEPGDYVLKATEGGKRKKLQPKWLGPYRVVRALGEVAYELEDLVSEAKFKVHVKKLAPFKRGEMTETEIKNLSLPDGMYLVEECLGHRGTGLNREFQIMWTGYAEPTWEPAEGVQGTDAVKNYCQQKNLEILH